MRSRWSAAVPYAAAVGGVATITSLIGVLRPWLDLPNLTVAYLLLVLWLGARFGWVPAVSAALLAFVAYDWFLVPPYGTLWISAPRELLNLVILVTGALVGGRLAATLAAREAGAAAEAAEAGALYELASAALREPAGAREPAAGAALSLLCDRAVAAGLRGLSLAADHPGGPALVAGAPLSDEELAQAGRVLAERRSVGARLQDGQLELVRTFPAQTAPAYVPLPGGVAVIRPPQRRLEADSRRLLAALLGLAGLLLDRRRAAEATERAAALETSDRLKAAVLSSMSHELRSPLASLRAGLTTLLIPGAGLQAEQRELVQGLDRQATRLDRLVGDLLTMSRLEAGLPPERSPQDLAELVGTVLREVEPALAGHRVEVALEPSLPPVLADELQVERVLTNLLENAAEWTPAGGRIGVGARPDSADGMVVAWVENEGQPIADADLERLFDKFWTRRRGGSGLGLAICRRVVEAHGGDIRAENGPAGPRFTFRLPAATGAQEAAEEAAEAAADAPAASR